MIKRLRPLLFAALGSLYFTAPVHASDTRCTGSNLMAAMERQEPQIAARLKAEAQAAPYGTGLTWKIEKQGVAPSYLYGTIHLSDPRLMTLKPATRNAFDQSQTVALEITEILDPAKMASKAFSLMRFTSYSDGSSLNDKLDDDQVAAISAAASDKLGLPWSVASRMKPWALMGSLALPACEVANRRAGKPFVDMKLGLNARKGGKTVVGLETLESQMAAMASLPESFAIKGLIQSATLGTLMDDLFETMIQLYLKEETAMIWSLMRRIGEQGFVDAKNNADYAAFQRIIVDARNRSMVEEAIHLIDRGGVFIAVGALHLPGDKGMVNILVQKGYKLTRVSG